MPAPRWRLSRDLFETRTHSWHEAGLGHELESQSPGRALGGLLVALTVLAAVLVVYYRRHELLPGYGPWVRAATVAILIIVGFLIRLFLQSTRPFRVGERVRLVGGALAGSLEGTVSSLGLFYATLVQGGDRLQVPNSVLISLVVVPLREPPKVDFRARFSGAMPCGSRRRV